MKSFDEWYFDLFESGNGSALNQQEIAEEAWDFRQAEIDELKREMLNKTNEAYADGQKSMRKMIKSNEDELKKRIDEALQLLTRTDITSINIARDILKGDSHEH